MVKISAVIITLNEEKNIERCIKALKDIADEILVVDSYSTDRTGQICEKLGIRFIQHPFESYMGQKQWAGEQATYDYILSVDADEIPSETLSMSLKEVKQNWNRDSWSFNRLNNYCGKWIRHSDWYPDRKIRLYDRRKAYWGGKNPHEKIVLKNGATTQTLKGDLLHYTYHSVQQHINQTKRYSEMAAKYEFDKGKKVSAAEMYIRFVWKFIRNYFIKLGILDGYSGLLVCSITAYGTLLKYKKLRNIHSQG